MMLEQIAPNKVHEVIRMRRVNLLYLFDVDRIHAFD